MVDAPQTMTVTAPADYKYVEGQPIQFELPVSSFDLTKLAPKDVAEKQYFKDKVKTSDDLFKLLDGSQTLLGQRPKYGTPAVDAPQEEWDAYLASQRAAKADDYTFEENPDAPAELKADDAFKKEVRQMFYDAGVNPKVASRLQKGYDALMMKLYTAKKTQQDAIDKQFNEMVKPIIGSDPKAMEAGFTRSKEVMAYLLPKELHGYIGKVNNEGLAIMVALTKAVEAKYMKEGELPGGGTNNGGTTKGELQTKARALMAEIQKMDNMDPQRRVKQDEVDSLYKQIATL